MAGDHAFFWCSLWGSLLRSDITALRANTPIAINNNKEKTPRTNTGIKNSVPEIVSPLLSAYGDDGHKPRCDTSAIG
jgi:hypothetical protein